MLIGDSRDRLMGVATPSNRTLTASCDAQQVPLTGDVSWLGEPGETAGHDQIAGRV
jgi:hypothetical protein